MEKGSRQNEEGKNEEERDFGFENEECERSHDRAEGETWSGQDEVVLWGVILNKAILSGDNDCPVTPHKYIPGTVRSI